MYVRGMLEISSWAVLRICQDGKAGCVKVRECLLGWNGAKYGNYCVGFDQSVHGRPEIVLKDSVQVGMWSTAMFKSGAETGAGNSFFSNVQGKWTAVALVKTSQSRSCFSTTKSLTETILCAFSQKAKCLLQMNAPACPVSVSEMRFRLGQRNLSKEKLWQFVTADGIKSPCLGSRSGVPQGSVPRPILLCLSYEQFTKTSWSFRCDTTPKSMKRLSEKTLNILDKQLPARIHACVNALLIRVMVPHHAE